MAESLKKYIPAVGHWWWVVAMGAVAPIIGLLLNVVGGIAVPLWVWITLGFASLSIAQFLAFHELRQTISRGQLVQQERHRGIEAELLHYQHYALLLREILRIPLVSEEPRRFIEWMELAMEWHKRVEKFLEEHVSRLELQKFKSDVGLTLGELEDADPAVARHYRRLDGELQRLQDLIDRKPWLSNPGQ